MRFQLLIVSFFVVMTGLFHQLDVAAGGDAHLWDAIGSGGHVVLIRHTTAPGVGDPAAFTLGDCTTQRNLSEAGREQARRIGRQFRQNGIRAARVYSSQWCRCLDTARLLDLGPVQELPVLNSFFRDFEREDAQTQALKAWIVAQDLAMPIVLVTHQVNITSLTGVYPSQGELVILCRTSDGALSVVGRMQPK